MKSPPAKTCTRSTITREVVSRRVRCPFCESTRRIVYATRRPDHFGDQTRYVRCPDCNRRWIWRETDTIE